MEIIESPEVHDVVVVGSGASGGMAAYNLTSQGVNVLMLDAGDKWDRNNFWTHVLPFEWEARVKKGERPPEFYLSREEQPIVTPAGQEFNLIRVWGLGGKTNVWGRVSLRMSDLDFKAAERDGWGIPWPISYADLQPYYDKVDQLIGVCGGDDDSEVLPGSRFHMPPPKLRCGEVIVKKAANSLGIPVVSIRRANLTRPHRGFPACHYCGECGRGCRTASFFNSAFHLIPFALETGKLKVVSNAVVARVLVDDKGLASGVQYFDRRTGVERQVRAKVVVMAASCMDSTRILLNSKSEKYPTGIGNTHDVLGRNFCEQQMVHLSGFLPQLFDAGYSNDDGMGGAHAYVPRFNHKLKVDYLRGFGMQLWGIGCQMTGAPVAANTPGFGEEFKRRVKKRYPSFVQVHPFGEVLARPENRVTVDESRTDRYGVPLMKVDVRFGENEDKMRRHMYSAAEEILHKAGAEINPVQTDRHDPPGSSIHEHGTCRMGADPKSSMLNKFNQMHAVKNVFVVDGSSFPNSSEKNPTLSILAVCWRATDHLAEELKRGNL